MNIIFLTYFHASNNAKIGMTLVSVCNSERSDFFINSQKSIIQNNENVFLTLNTYNLGINYRYDGVHFYSLGASKIGKIYSELINKLNN